MHLHRTGVAGGRPTLTVRQPFRCDSRRCVAAPRDGLDWRIAMTILTFAQAARLTSLGKTTLARALKSGRLGRVYPFPAPVEAANATNAATNDHAASLEIEIAA